MGTTQAGAVFLTAKEILRRGNLQLTTVPYSGAGPYLTALLGGHIDSALSPMAAAESHLKAGTMRLLAVTGHARMKNHASVPTVSELGIDVPYVQWVGIVAPRGLPQDRLARLREAFAQMAKDPAFLEAAEKMGVDVAYSNGDEFEKQVRAEDQLIAALVKDLGLKPQ
jgi:tripartite-type tricarboxylate transporter receptor subunit TctC